MLKGKLDQTGYDKLDESIQAFYKGTDEGYILQAEGMVSKSKLDEFRENNIALKEGQKKLEGIDLDKYHAMLETERKVREKELIDKGQFETLMTETTNVMKSDYEAKLEAANTYGASFEDKYNKLITKQQIDDVASKAFIEHQISPQAQELLMNSIRNKFSLDSGQVIAREGDEILTGANGNLTVNEFVAQHEFLKIANQSGAGRGNEGAAINHQPRSSQDKILAGLRGRA